MSQAPNPLWDELGKTIFLRGDIFDGKRQAEYGLNAELLVRVSSQTDAKLRQAETFSVLGKPTGHVTLDAQDSFRFQAGQDGFDEWTSIQALLRNDDATSRKESFIKICRLMDRLTEGETEGWQDFIEAVEADRFEATTWQERDRTHLGLKDTLFNESVFDFWDEDAVSAIDDGLIAPPRGPRPFSGPDSAWLPSMLEYAESNGLITPLRQESAAPAPAPRG